MSEWIVAMKDADLKEEKIKVIKTENKQIALVKKGDGIFALLNVCPHAGCPLKNGSLEEYTLKCACHNWGFDIRTGENVDTGEYIDMEDPSVDIFETRIEDGNIEILV